MNATGHAATIPATNFRRQVYCLLGLPFDAVSRREALHRIDDAASVHWPCFLSTPNLNFLAASLTDPAFRDSVIHSDLSVVDGMPLVWIARALGVPLPERVAGSDLFETFMRDEEHPLKVFFFGGDDGVAEAACRRINDASGPVRCVGYVSPGFGTVEQMSHPALIERINASGADIVAVSLGARKGQAWIARNRAALRAPVVSHLGAVVNFVAGTVSRAPAGMRRLGLEWLWRIKEEPALWLRYVNDGRALLALLATRVAPALLDRARDALRPSRVPPALSVSRQQSTKLALAGTLRDEDLPTLREALVEITREPGDIEIDLECAGRLGPGVIGSLMLLYGHQARIGCAFGIVATSPAARRALRLACAQFLLEPLPASARLGNAAAA